MTENIFTRNTIGLIGIVIALMGVGVAIFQDDLRPDTQAPPVEMTDRVVEKGAELLGIEVKRESPSDVVMIIRLGLGFLAIVLGVVSWIRKENHRVSSTAAALGIIVVAWEYVLIAVGVAIIILILGSLGF